MSWEVTLRIRPMAGVLGALLLLVAPCKAAPLSTVPTVSLGNGQSMVVEYDLEFRPIRKYVGLHKPVDITPLADGTILLVDEAVHQVMLFDASGAVHWSERIGNHPLRARLLPDGGYLITAIGEMIATRPDRTIEWRQAVKGITTAAPLADGNILTATNEGNGWLTERTPDGTVVWQSKPRGWVTVSGRWVDEDPDEYFLSVSSLDVGDDGTIFTTDYDRHHLRLLSPDYQSMRTVGGLHHVTDTRIGPAGELVAVSPEDFRVWLRLPDGTTKSLQPHLRPYSANVSYDGNLLVGLISEPEQAVMNATAQRSKELPHVPWSQRALPVGLIAVVGGLMIAVVLRWRELVSMWAGTASPHRAGAEERVATGRVVSSPVERRSLVTTRRLMAAVWVGMLAGGAYFAWEGIGLVQRQGFSHGLWRFALGCLVAGVALRMLNALVGCSDTLSSFVPAQWQPPLPRPGRVRLTALCFLSLSSIVGCLYVLSYHSEAQASGVALWLMAQIWIVAAAFPSVQPVAWKRTPRRVWLLLGLVLLGAFVSRFWEIGYYPDYVHHDHSIYGDVSLRTLRGEWTTFFTRVYSIGLPWLVVSAGALELFGSHYWVLRLLGAIAGVAVVWGAYMLGASLFNRRVGLIGALLVTSNHVLLLYSRQPYVLDPLAPFVFALYCMAVGLQRGCRFHWCLSGVLSGWALMAYYSSATFPPVGAAVFLYLLFVYPRWLWRSRTGLLWFLAGVGIVYAPFLSEAIAGGSLHHRLVTTLVFLNPDGSIRWDGALWAHQLERSFGSIFYYGDTGPWGVSTGESISMRYGSCLFGIGLAYLLTSWRTPATFLVISWAIICIFLGSATLPNPPAYYHMLAAVVPIMLGSAVPLDRALALTDRWRSRLWRLPFLVALLALLGAVSVSNLNAFWLAVRRPSPSEDGQTVFRANAAVMAARFIRDHPQYRHYLVRSRNDITSTNPTFRFFAADSDLSDISTDLTGTLPVPPVGAAAGASFIVLPSRSTDRHVISDVYPSVTVKQLHHGPSKDTLWVYLVDGKTVEQAYKDVASAGTESTLHADGG